MNLIFKNIQHKIAHMFGYNKKKTEMKLWILKQNDKLERDDDPWWFSPYDTFEGFVIRAETESIARELAAEKSKLGGESDWEAGNPWLSTKYTSCNELTTLGTREIILADLNNG